MTKSVTALQEISQEIFFSSMGQREGAIKISVSEEVGDVLVTYSGTFDCSSVPGNTYLLTTIDAERDVQVDSEDSKKCKFTIKVCHYITRKYPF